MTEKEKPQSSKEESKPISKETMEHIKSDRLEKIGQIIEKGHLKNSWEKPIPNIDKTAVLKPPPATAKPTEDKAADSTDKK